MKKITSPYAFFILFFLITAVTFSQIGWFQQNSGTTSHLSYIEMIDGNTGFICKPFLKTTDGGANWITLTTPVFTSIEMIDANTGYALNDVVYKTINGGYNWSTVTPPGSPLYWYASFINAQTGFVGGYQDQIYLFMSKTTTGGSNWSFSTVLTAPDFPNQMHFNDIEAVNTNTVYCTVYYYDEVYPYEIIHYFKRTTDGGSFWSTIMQSQTVQYFDISFPTANTGYVTGQAGSSYYIYKGVNNSWQQSLSSASAIISIDFPNSLTGFAVGTGGIIHKTTNGGTNWYTVNSGTTETLTNLKFINSETGWVIGRNGLILKTTTGGEVPVIHSVSGTIRYQDNNDPVTSGYVKALRYDSVSHNIITVDSAQIQSNGAYTLPNCPPVYLDIMAYENDEDALSFVPTYYTSTINWQNATHIKPDSNLSNINVAVKRIINPGDSMHVAGYVYTNNASDYSALKDAVVYSRASGVFKSHSISLVNGYYCVDSLPSGVYELIVDRMGYIGGSFVVTIANSSLNNVNFYLDDILLPVSGVSGELPKDFRLSQNHPNPFNPATSIEFSIPEDSYAKLTIYDVLGREVAVLIDQQLKRGVYRETWNAANYPSGVYFYKLQTGGFTETKKMILIK